MRTRRPAAALRRSTPAATTSIRVATSPRRALPPDVEAHRADTHGVQAPDLGIGGVAGYLRDSDELRAQRAQCRNQVALVKALERARDDGAPFHAEAGHTVTVVLDGEGRGKVSVVLLQRKPWIDDVQMRIEEQGWVPQTFDERDAFAY